MFIGDQFIMVIYTRIMLGHTAWRPGELVSGVLDVESTANLGWNACVCGVCTLGRGERRESFVEKRSSSQYRSQESGSSLQAGVGQSAVHYKPDSRTRIYVLFRDLPVPTNNERGSREAGGGNALACTIAAVRTWCYSLRRERE
jgi:hypothetical protein